MKKILFGILLLGGCTAAFAQSEGTAGNPAASIVFPSSVLSHDPVSNAGINAFSSDEPGVWISFQNVNPKSETPSTDFSLATTMRFRALTVGLEYSHLASKEYELTGDYGVVEGTFKPVETDLGVRIHYALDNNMKIKVRTRFLGGKYSPDVEISAVCADLGFEYKTDAIRGIVGVNSLGAKVGANKLPTSLMLAGRYDILKSEKMSVNAIAQADYFLYGAARAAVGVEGSYNFVVARFGANIASKDCVLPTFFNAGVGLRFGVFEANVSTIVGGTLGGSVLCGVTYKY